MDDDDFWVSTRSLGRTGRPSRRFGARAGRGSDPFVRRLLVLGVAFALLLPVFMALRGNGSPAAVVPAPGAVAVIEPAAVQVPASVQSMSAAPQAAPVASTPALAAAVPQATTAPTLARRPSCASPYTAVRGDFWLRIARIHGVRLSRLLQANSATVSTPLYPGSKVCLPSGATRAVTATTAPRTATTQARTTATTQPKTATTTRPTTATTAPPATAAPRSYTRQQVIDIIRYVWPDQLEDRAIQIATRESNLVPTARSSCCSGLFQIYYSVHKGWLAGLGITSAQMLLDPVLNSQAALDLYQRAGGWGPWGA
jgi:LysM repeat protein